MSAKCIETFFAVYAARQTRNATFAQLFPDVAVRYVMEHQPERVAAQMTMQPNGNWLAIGLRGTVEQIENAFALLSNHGATYGELVRDSDTLGFFWTTRAHLVSGLRALWCSRLNRHCKKYRGRKGGFYHVAHKLALRQIARLEQETGLIRRNEPNPDKLAQMESFEDYLMNEAAKEKRLETLREVAARHN